MAIRNIEGIFPEKIEAVGNVRRVYFQALIVFDDDRKEWHYFGSTLDDIPARSSDPAFEHPFVQFPQGMDDLETEEANDFLFKLGRISGFRREGLTSPND